MKKNPNFIIQILCTSLLLLNFSSCKPEKITTSFEAMNTFMTIQSYGKNSTGKNANQKVQQRISEIENHISTTKNGSSVWNLNNFGDFGENKSVKVDDDTFLLVNFGLEIGKKTEGALNIALYPITSAWGFTTGNYKVPQSEEIQELLKITNYTLINLQENNEITLPYPMKIDLGAVGKGFAGDEAIKILRQEGINSAILDLGGNIQTLGSKPDGSDWTIGIKNPDDGSVAAAIKIKNQAVITSGGYERFFTTEDGTKYIHIFDGKTGYPVENEISGVTIICDSGLYGDALSTAMFVLGINPAIEYWKNNQDFEMIIITKSHEILYTEGLESKISVLTNFKSKKIIKK